MEYRYGFKPSSAPIRRVRYVQFGVLPPQQVKNGSVVHVTHANIMDESGQRPLANGLLDMRMGTIDRDFKCQTCGETMKECPGHFGHIELARPVYHPGFLDKIKKILECICYYCGRLKVDEESPNFLKATSISNLKVRFKFIWDMTKGKTVCDGGKRTQRPQVEELNDGKVDNSNKNTTLQSYCGHKQPTYRKDGIRLIVHFKVDKDEQSSLDTKRVFTTREAISVLKKITDRDLYLMGLNGIFARPEWLLLSNLPVPPPQVRPSITVDGTGRSEDDLTYKLAEIIKANDVLKLADNEGTAPMISDEFEYVLGYHTATLMDNDIAGIPQSTQKSGRPIKSLRARLKGKEGRIRGNLMGKRVDFSARTVITGDPNISINEVGVPYSIAMNLTYPEMVTRWNIERLQQHVDNGGDVYPGAKFVITNNNDRIDLRINKNMKVNLQIGYMVERHLIDGDTIIFNRQPSLHKMSMMGHYVRVLHHSTFRLNLSVTSPYNADFDGDEMNLHVPQTEEARAEVQELCMVPKQIVSPQANKPVMGIVQDTLCGIYKFTRRDTFIRKHEMNQLVIHIPNFDGKIPPPAIKKPIELWTGKQLFSMIIPKGVNLIGKHSAHPDDEDPNEITTFDTHVEVINGELLCGIICKKTIGASAGGFVHVIQNDFGPVVCMNFFNATQQLINHWMLNHGFTIGIGDMIPNEKTLVIVKQTVSEAKEKVEKYIEDAVHDELDVEPGLTIPETFEYLVTRELNKARDTAGKAAEKNLPESNNIKQMVVAGSKGSFINISQITACVGQQNVEGKRIPYGFKQRTLPHFTKCDIGPLARGFVENSYLRGLTPQEFFFHAMGGREGLIDTAVKTAETGYIQRRLVKAMEDAMVRYDGTVRNALGHIIQFVYGEDGMDAAYIEKQPIDMVKMSDEAFLAKYKIIVDSKGYLVGPDKYLDMSFIINYFSERDTAVLLNEELFQLRVDRQLVRMHVFKDGESNWPMPVNISRLIKNAQVNFYCAREKPSDLHPYQVILAVRDLVDELVVIRGNDEISHEANENATVLFKILIRSYLAAKRVICEFFLSYAAFDWIIKEIRKKFDRAIVHPGEMVGTLAAQSIGEPATQMTLNTFHLAGVSNTTTQGVPRLKEIINVATNLKTPSMTIALKDHAKLELGDAKTIQSRVEHLTISRLADFTQIIFDPNIEETNIHEDAQWIQDDLMMGEMGIIYNKLRAKYISKWVLRIVFIPEQLQLKRISLETIAESIERHYPTNVVAYHSDEASQIPVLHCRLCYDSEEELKLTEGMSEFSMLSRVEQNMLSEITIIGVPMVNRVFVMPKSSTYLNDFGEYKRREEFQLSTLGTNLKDVLALDFIDGTNSFSNNIVETLEVLGIEATRNAILRELRSVIEGGGSYVNYRHLALLVDTMTSRGTIMAITRHGINRTEAGALMRCSFEETVEILLEAAASGESDNCKGISENIMLGQLAPLGTGSFDILLDEKTLNDIIIPEQSVEDIVQVKHRKTNSNGGIASPQFTPYDVRSPQRVDMASIGGSSIVPQFSPIPSGSGLPNFSPMGDIRLSSPVKLPGIVAPGPTSPGYSPTSPQFTPASPSFSPSSPKYSPGSPSYQPSSPMKAELKSSRLMKGSEVIKNTQSSSCHTAPFPLGPASSTYNPSMIRGPSSPGYSPTSPSYSPTSPSNKPTASSQIRIGPKSTIQVYSPNAPSYSPTSPGNTQSPNVKFSPVSPSYSPSSPGLSSTRGQALNAGSPSYRAQGSSYSPTSSTAPGLAAGYSPTSPSYSPTSPGNNRLQTMGHLGQTRPSAGLLFRPLPLRPDEAEERIKNNKPTESGIHLFDEDRVTKPNKVVYSKQFECQIQQVEAESAQNESMIKTKEVVAKSEKHLDLSFKDDTKGVREIYDSGDVVNKETNQKSSRSPRLEEVIHEGENPKDE